MHKTLCSSKCALKSLKRINLSEFKNKCKRPRSGRFRALISLTQHVGNLSNLGRLRVLVLEYKPADKALSYIAPYWVALKTCELSKFNCL